MEVTSVFELSVTAGIIVFYGLAAYYNLLWCVQHREHYQRWLRVMYFGVDMLFILIFLTIGISVLVGHSLTQPSFGSTFIRPTILASGVVNAIGARFRYFEDRCR